MRRHLSAAAVLILLVPWPGAAPAQPGALAVEHDGIVVVGMYPPPGVAFDVPILDPRQGLENIVGALSLIRAESPFSASRIEALKNNGSVFIVYDPSYPKKAADVTSLHMAAFLPQFFDSADIDNPAMTFLVVVSRHGIKKPRRDLASTLIHELAGHGIQHLEGRLDGMRVVDLECEAWLYKEMAHQDFGMDKFAKRMIEFRQQLALNCDAFLRHLRQNDPAGLAEAQFGLGVIYQKGLGVRRDLAEAVGWYRRAAGQGIEQAKKNLAWIVRDHPEIRQFDHYAVMSAFH